MRYKDKLLLWITTKHHKLHYKIEIHITKILSKETTMFWLNYLEHMSLLWNFNLKVVQTSASSASFHALEASAFSSMPGKGLAVL